MRGNVMATPFPLSNRATDVRPGCKTQKIAPTLREVADLLFRSGNSLNPVVSYQSKKEKNVFLLSTMHSVPGRCETSGKPEIVLTL
ncbi:hypothetical protein PoB_001027000 [Plakobranchus ocellatus]|uniref:Uncharacterized protein n=1 Tax=Plakobranchus ocellatus TaxID=259542 RepID=A0AAV3YKW8_9GAST|nr:hypothetical protein PoB_001027000 [Plakobranchus ocellatus]